MGQVVQCWMRRCADWRYCMRMSTALSSGGLGIEDHARWLRKLLFFCGIGERLFFKQTQTLLYAERMERLCHPRVGRFVWTYDAIRGVAGLLKSRKRARLVEPDWREMEEYHVSCYCICSVSDRTWQDRMKPCLIISSISDRCRASSSNYYVLTLGVACSCIDRRAAGVARAGALPAARRCSLLARLLADKHNSHLRQQHPLPASHTHASHTNFSRSLTHPPSLPHVCVCGSPGTPPSPLSARLLSSSMAAARSS